MKYLIGFIIFAQSFAYAANDFQGQWLISECAHGAEASASPLANYAETFLSFSGERFYFVFISYRDEDCTQPVLTNAIEFDHKIVEENGRYFLSGTGIDMWLTVYDQESLDHLRDLFAGRDDTGVCDFSEVQLGTPYSSLASCGDIPEIPPLPESELVMTDFETLEVMEGEDRAAVLKKVEMPAFVIHP